MFDDFSTYKPFTLLDGQKSPVITLPANWIAAYNGYGSQGVQLVDGKNVFVQQPKTATSTNTNPYETHACLCNSIALYGDSIISCNVRTVRQLRQNLPPRGWECGWIFFRYTDANNFYYFTWKPEGIELGKTVPAATPGATPVQVYLYDPDTPKLTLNTWSRWQITAVGNHITVWLNGIKYVDFVDKTMSAQLASGSVGMYCEDALVNFANLSINSVYSL